MLIGSENALKSLAIQIDAFAASPQLAGVFEVETTDDPTPYEQTLMGLRVTKSGGQQLAISEDRWLELLATTEELQSLASLLRQPVDGNHAHFYSKPVSLIIEEGEPWIQA